MPFLTEVTIPVWLNRRQQREKQDTALYGRRLQETGGKAGYILQSLWNRQRRYLEKCKPAANRKSTWSDYTDTCTHYLPEQAATKENFVQEALRGIHAQRVLDIGCNTGYFSAIAAKQGASVVAIDGDAVVVGQTWVRAQAGHLSILPLVVNIARPTPATGWRNGETASFLQRARGAFDCVLMLAVIHHLAVTERIPLPEIVRLAAELTTVFLVIEFVGAEDPMFRRLTRGREHLHQEYTQPYFEECCRHYFEVVSMLPLPHSSRTLYLLRKCE